jgi:cob(I)alamin adenosyltransferase
MAHEDGSTHFCFSMFPVRAYHGAMLERGLIQVYTGDGKGKTTAALGLALRAAGQGNKVLIYQFLKPPSLELGERRALERGSAPIRIEAMDEPWDLSHSLDSEQDVARVKTAISGVLARLTDLAQRKSYNVLILDEIVFCLSAGLAEFEDLQRLIEQRDPAVEIVLTGRGATPKLIELADLVTEMKEIKHPFDQGTPARRGIEY